MIGAVLGIVIAWVYSHVLEYYAHKFLHRFKRKGQLMSFHMREHHVNAKRQWMSTTPGWKEAFYLGILALLHLPVAWVSVPAYATLLLCSLHYLYVHSRSHLDVNWGCDNVPWHVDHHLGNQQANWGVRSDWVDRLLGTKDSRR